MANPLRPEGPLPSTLPQAGGGGAAPASGSPTIIPSLRPGSSATARLLRLGGWFLIAAGCLILLFLTYELFGTGLYTRRAQSDLKKQVEGWQRADPGLKPAPAAIRPVPGTAVARLVIPKIGLDLVVVEGVSPADLKRGPGHMPGTPPIGSKGNAVVSGHRTTYGAPFWSLDRLAAGDEVYAYTREGKFVYRVEWVRVVAPDELWVIEPTPVPSLTLTTCNPRFSAAQRLVVRAVLARSETP